VAASSLLEVSTIARASADRPSESWAYHGDLRLHYLDARPSAPGPTVVVVPGFGEEALDHLPLIVGLAPRRVVAADLRGRGPSSPSTTGYRIEDHAADLRVVLAAAAVGPVHLVTYSRGTSYGLAWALAHPAQVKSITIGDYPAAQIVPPATLPDMAARRIWKQRPMTERMPRAVIEAMVADTVAIEFWDDLAELDRPVLLIRGAMPGSMVTDAVEARYRQAVRDLRVVVFEDSGHDLWNPDPDRFHLTVAAFLDDLEGRSSRGR
jgi:non-heme chloroperoxidase